MRTSYTLVCGAAGVGLSECLSNMQKYLEDESQIKPNFKDIGDYIEEKNYRSLLSKPMPSVFSRVHDALRSMMTGFAANERSNALCAHLTLYDARTQVFYSPIDAESLVAKKVVDSSEIEIRPDRIILLIDDIFDMLTSLNRPEDIFRLDGVTSDTVDFLTHAAQCETLDGSPLINTQETTLAALDAEVSLLQYILSWRRSEMVTAEALAKSLDVPLYLVGIKHPVELAELLFAKIPPKAVYISHPITRHRNAQATDKRWSSDVGHLNSIPRHFASRGVVSLMPTAIDELRFAPPTGRDLFLRTGGLRDRWPCMNSDYSLISPRYSIGQTNHAGIASFEAAFSQKGNRKAASVYLRALEGTVYREIPFRDHFLVNHCEGLLVFRPQEGGNSFSAGVRAEIHFFEALAREGNSRRMVVLHDTDDIPLILRRLEQGTLVSPHQAIQAARDYISKHGDERLHHVLSEAEKDSVLMSARTVNSQLEGRTCTFDEVALLVSEAWQAAAEMLLYLELTGLNGVYEDWAHIVVGDSGSPKVLKEAAAWLAGRDCPPTTLLERYVKLPQIAASLARVSGASVDAVF